tara:strand:+ start:1361 stop:1564 length:204 start_codon:yes stop_codon:yes gene_type:complete
VACFTDRGFLLSLKYQCENPVIADAAGVTQRKSVCETEYCPTTHCFHNAAKNNLPGACCVPGYLVRP